MVELSSPKSMLVTPPERDTALACPVCASPTVEIYRDDGSDRALVASDLGSSRNQVSHGKILRCRTCGFGFRAYRPSEQELASLYRELNPVVYEKESSGRQRTARRHLQIVRRYVPGGRVLDVGCASGAFLSCAFDEGFEVVGIEPSSVLCGMAEKRLRGRGTILCCVLQNAILPQASMDVLTLWDVLEHVPDSLAFLRHCASLVKPGGYLIANVPDLESWQARLLGDRWPLLLAEHLNYFSRKSLALVGKASHLQVIRFGRRPSSFTLDYVLYRLGQHNFPGAETGRSLIKRVALDSVSIPAYLGETYVVWKRKEQSRGTV